MSYDLPPPYSPGPSNAPAGHAYGGSGGPPGFGPRSGPSSYPPPGGRSYVGDAPPAMAGTAPPGPGNSMPVSKVEISVSARNLIDMDVFSKSDPICVAYLKEATAKDFREIGRTEVIWDNLNPEFVRKFIVDYYFEETQQLKFVFYDVDDANRVHDLSLHDFLGEMRCTLAEIVSSSAGEGLKRHLEGVEGKTRGSMGMAIVTAEEVASCKDEVHLRLRGENLDKKDFFGKSDPFLTISRSNENGTFTIVHKTPHIKRTLNPKWPPFVVPVRVLCNGDHDRSLRIDCYDWNKSGSHELIGCFTTNLREMLQMKGGSEVINPKKRSKRKYKNSGVIVIDECWLEAVPTFLDYIRGGCEMNCTIAIDFTASNGDPRTPQSLHHMASSQRPSQYAIALSAVGRIIQDYDSDNLFPALGFGAKVPPNWSVSHEFFLNMNPTNPYCQGIEGVLQAYKLALQSVQLYGPTNFAPVINHVARIAAETQDGSQYYILLILTDGIITDMPQTREAVVQAARLPVSIIIVGIGDADFDAMEELDGDDVRISSRGVYAERDIVQFVPMRDFLKQRGGSSLTTIEARLAKEVLAEIPDQLVSFMRSRGISPGTGRSGAATAPVAAMASDISAFLHMGNY